MSNALTAFPAPVNVEERQTLLQSPINALQPRTLGAAMELSQILCTSELVPESYRSRPANVLIAIMYGAELGMTVVQSLQNIAVVNGRATVWGDAPLSIVRARAGELLEAFTEGWEDGKDDAERRAWCEVKRHGDAQPIRRTFSIADAKQAGLLDKKGDLYQKYPRRMCKFKARNEALRDAFPDLLLGIAMREDADEWANPAGALPGHVVDDRQRTLDDEMTEWPEEIRAKVVTAFDALHYSPAERLVTIRKYQRDADRILAWAREEFTLRKTNGKSRTPSPSKKGAAQTTANPPATEPAPVAAAVPAVQEDPVGSVEAVGPIEVHDITEGMPSAEDEAPVKAAATVHPFPQAATPALENELEPPTPKAGRKTAEATRKPAPPMNADDLFL